jgi:hypothetical protein
MTLIVRLTCGAAGAITGVIERVRTGQKERFEGIDGLTAVVTRLAAQERAAEIPKP